MNRVAVTAIGSSTATIDFPDLEHAKHQCAKEAASVGGLFHFVHVASWPEATNRNTFFHVRCQGFSGNDSGTAQSTQVSLPTLMHSKRTGLAQRHYGDAGRRHVIVGHEEV